MRAGSHPLKKQGKLEPPKDITIQMVTFIPFLSGYFEQSLDVLKLSLESLWENTLQPYELMIFDNGSCSEVRDYLLEQQELHKIQFLYLSDENVGLPGAWNALFAAAPGKIIAYSDSDIFFYPGWLEACVELLTTYPNVGMVTGIPVRNPPKFNSRTIQWAEATPEVKLQRGHIMDWEIFWAHTRSLGIQEPEARQKYTDPGEEDFFMTYRGLPAAAGAGHFQYVSYRSTLQKVLPFPYIMPMGNERYLDEKINDLGFLRLTTTKMCVRHIGNRLPPDGELPPVKVQGRAVADSTNQALGKSVQGKRLTHRILDIPFIRRILLGFYNRIFRLYYDRK